MKSKTSSFNKTLFFGLWKRFWPLFAAYLAIWVMVLPISVGSTLGDALRRSTELATGVETDAGSYVTSLAAGFGSNVLSLASSAGTILAVIFCVLVAMAAYSYLYNPRSVSAMCSLPMKREDVFRTQMLSGLSLLLLINLAVCLITVAVGAFYGAKAGFDAAYVFEWLGIVCLQDVFFYGFATICASFTGNVVVLPLVYFVLNFAVCAFSEMINAVMNYFVYGYCASTTRVANWFSPPIELVQDHLSPITRKLSDTSALVTGYTFTGWCELLIYAAVGVAFACFAVVILKRRRMESAGDVVALRPLKPAFKYCMTAGGALVLGLMLFSLTNIDGRPTYVGMGPLLLMLFYMLLGGFVGYFASEMLMQKTLRVFTGKWAGFGVSCAVIAALLLCLRFDAFGVERYIPDSAEIEGVSISADGFNALLEEPENVAAAIALQKDLLAHKAENNAAYTQDGTTYSINFLYTRKDGKAIMRGYTLYLAAKTNDISDLGELLNTKEAVKARKSLSLPVNLSTILDPSITYFDKDTMEYVSISLSSDEMYDLYTNCIVPDTDEMKLGKIWLIPDESYYSRVLDCQISFTVQTASSGIKKPQADERVSHDTTHFDTTLTLDAARTYDWIESHKRIPLTTMGEGQKLQKKAAQEGNPVSQTDIKTVYGSTYDAG